MHSKVLIIVCVALYSQLYVAQGENNEEAPAWPSARGWQPPQRRYSGFGFLPQDSVNLTLPPLPQKELEDAAKDAPAPPKNPSASVEKTAANAAPKNATAPPKNPPTPAVAPKVTPPPPKAPLPKKN